MNLPARSLIATVLVWYAGTASVHAATLYNRLGQRSIPQIVGFVIQAALGISGSIALLMIVYGGFVWLTSRGEPDKIKKGQQTIVWSVIGIAVLFGANILATYIINTLGGATAGG